MLFISSTPTQSEKRFLARSSRFSTSLAPQTLPIALTLDETLPAHRFYWIQ